MHSAAWEDNSLRPTSRADIGSEVVGIVNRAVHSLASRCSPESWTGAHGSDRITAAIFALHATNVRQWAAEDNVRSPRLSDHEIVRIKREIDTHNLLRHEGVEEIDEAFTERVALNPDAELHTETVGNIVDRLSVLELRRYHFGRIESISGRTDQQGVRDLLAVRIADLQDGLERLVARCVSGERRISRYRAHKLYGNG